MLKSGLVLGLLWLMDLCWIASLLVGSAWAQVEANGQAAAEGRPSIHRPTESSTSPWPEARRWQRSLPLMAGSFSHGSFGSAVRLLALRRQHKLPGDGAEVASITAMAPINCPRSLGELSCCERAVVGLARLSLAEVLGRLLADRPPNWRVALGLCQHHPCCGRGLRA